MKKLYILMRSELASIYDSPGRACAQASHASNKFVHDIQTIYKNNNSLLQEYQNWSNQTRYGFGTVIVLDGGSQSDIENLIYNLDDEKYLFSAVIDPEYGIRDGNFVHMFPDVMTCAYVFPLTNDVSELENLELY